MNKTTALILKITIVIILVVSVLVGYYYYRSYVNSANEIADIVNKGNAYMEAQCYTEAIECYKKAMEYDKNTDELKSAIVQAYMELAASYNDTDDAIICYQSALSFDTNNKKAYWAIADIYEGRGEEDTMIEILEKGYEDTQDETMFAKYSAILDERARIAAEEEAKRLEEEEQERIAKERAQKLEPLLQLFIDKDYTTLKEELRKEEYIDFSDELIGDNSYYFGNTDVDGNRTGTGIAVYENGYFYYGDFENNVRSGQGVLMRASYAESSSIGSFIFEGEWKDDAPNGKGTATSNYYKDRISASDFVTKEISGNYTDGREDGTMTLKGRTKSGVSQTFTYKATGGIAEKSSSEDSGVEGQYIIAQTKDKSQSLTSDGSIRGVEGFIDDESTRVEVSRSVTREIEQEDSQEENQNGDSENTQEEQSDNQNDETGNDTQDDVLEGDFQFVN